MPKSKLRGGKKEHRRRIENRTQVKEVRKKTIQKKFDEFLQQQMEARANITGNTESQI
jgi:hypothetical protein